VKSRPVNRGRPGDDSTTQAPAAYTDIDAVMAAQRRLRKDLQRGSAEA